MKCGGAEVRNDTLCGDVFRRVEDGHAHVFTSVEIAKPNRMISTMGDTQYDQHRPPVAQDVVKFFFTNAKKLVSCLLVVLRAVPQVVRLPAACLSCRSGVLFPAFGGAGEVMEHAFHIFRMELFFQFGGRVQRLDAAVHHDRDSVAVFRFVHTVW